jgi:integrase
MARKVRDGKIETRTARLKLTIRRKPFFVAVASGISLGYRRNAGAGTWVVRCADGQGGNWTKAFASADDFETANGGSVLDFWAAQDKARELARIDEATNTERPATVGEAIEAYSADLAARGANEENAQMLRHNAPPSMKAKAVALLTEKELRTWRNGLVKRGVKPATADRVARVFKACLNLAATDDPRITNSNAWRNGLTRLPEGETARNIILSDEAVRDIIAAAYADSEEFGRFIECLASTGARESQLLRLDVEDIIDTKTPRLMMPSSRKGKHRHISRKPIAITPRLLLVLKQAAKGRNGRLFDEIYKVSKRFREVTEHLKLDRATTTYALRHSSIVRMLMAGTPTRVVAAHHDTSVPMLEKHYSRYIIGDASDAMVRASLLDLDTPATPSNVIAIR